VRIRELGLARVIGVDNDYAVSKRAEERGAADETHLELEHVRDADVVIIAVPPEQTVTAAREGGGGAGARRGRAPHVGRGGAGDRRGGRGPARGPSLYLHPRGLNANRRGEHNADAGAGSGDAAGAAHARRA